MLFCLAAIFGVGSSVVLVGLPSALAAEQRASCSKRVTREAFTEFLTAFNRGDVSGLDSLFALEPKFQWYSSPAPGRRLNRASFRRKTLADYFRARHRDGDRMRLRSFHFNGRSSSWSNFSYHLDRQTTSFYEGAWFQTIGKGALECSTGNPQIIVMSLGGPEPSAKEAALPGPGASDTSGLPWWIGLCALGVLIGSWGIVRRRRGRATAARRI
jgi:hypothetical protein